MTRLRLDPAVRKQQILDAALSCACKHGYDRMTREQIGKAATCSGPTVQHYFPTMAALRRAVMRAAVRNECLPVVAQGLVRGDKQAEKADPDLRRRAMEAYQ